MQSIPIAERNSLRPWPLRFYWGYSQYVPRQSLVDRVNDASAVSCEQISADKGGQGRDHQLVHGHGARPTSSAPIDSTRRGLDRARRGGSLLGRRKSGKTAHGKRLAADTDDGRTVTEPSVSEPRVYLPTCVLAGVCVPVSTGRLIVIDSHWRSRTLEGDFRRVCLLFRDKLRFHERRRLASRRCGL